MSSRNKIVKPGLSTFVSSVCCRGDGHIKMTSGLCSAIPADDYLVMRCQRVKYGCIVTVHTFDKDWPCINKKLTIEGTYIVAKILVRSVVVEVPRKPFSRNVWIGYVDIVYMKCQIDKKWLFPWIALLYSNNMNSRRIRADNDPKGAPKENKEQLCNTLFGKAENTEKVAGINTRERFENAPKRHGTTDTNTFQWIWNLVCLAVVLCLYIPGAFAMDPPISEWVHKPNNLCTGKLNLEHCPRTSTDRLFRERMCLRFLGPSNGTAELLYHCQYDDQHGQFFEFMAKSHKCPKGHFGKIQSKYNVVRIVCTLCPDNSYEPEPTLSPLNLKGCHYKRHEVNPREHLILYMNGTPSSPDIYFCNYVHGYYSEFHDMFCDFHKPCRCRNEEKCSICNGQPMELLPDGTCHTKCDFPRLPENNFTCCGPGISGKEALYSENTEIVINVEGSDKACRTAGDNEHAEPVHVIYVFIGLIVAAIVFAAAVVAVLFIVRKLRSRRYNPNGCANTSVTYYAQDPSGISDGPTGLRINMNGVSNGLYGVED